jgi:hypothetical protein
MGVDLKSVAIADRVLNHMSECHTIADAGIESRKSCGKDEAFPQPSGFSDW